MRIYRHWHQTWYLYLDQVQTRSGGGVEVSACENIQTLGIKCGNYLSQSRTTRWGGGVAVGVCENVQTLGIQCGTYLDQV